MIKRSKNKKSRKETKIHNNGSEERVSMYFRLDSPIELRRNILRTAIDLTQLLKGYESFKGLRHLKSEAFQDFHRVYRELEFLTKKLKTRDLPIIKKIEKDILSARQEQQKMQYDQAHEMHIEQEQDIAQEKEIHITDTDKLDEELRDIQTRLRNLDV